MPKVDLDQDWKIMQGVSRSCVSFPLAEAWDRQLVLLKISFDTDFSCHPKGPENEDEEQKGEFQEEPRPPQRFFELEALNDASEEKDGKEGHQNKVCIAAARHLKFTEKKTWEL